MRCLEEQDKREKQEQCKRNGRFSVQITFKKLKSTDGRQTEKSASSWRRRGFIAGIWQSGACHLPGQEVLPSCTSLWIWFIPRLPCLESFSILLKEQPHCWFLFVILSPLKQLMPAESLSKLQPGLFSEENFPSSIQPPEPPSSWSLPLKATSPPAQGSWAGSLGKSSWSV